MSEGKAKSALIISEVELGGKRHYPGPTPLKVTSEQLARLIKTGCGVENVNTQKDPAPEKGGNKKDKKSAGKPTAGKPASKSASKPVAAKSAGKPKAKK